jgi:hypothetical protein
MPSYLATALIAFGGVVIGAFASVGTQLWIERARADRERAAHDREVKTAARMMQTDLARARSNLDYSHRVGRWWPDPGLQSRLSDSDRRLVIGALTPEGFYSVDLAEGAIDQWYGTRQNDMKTGDLLAPVYDPADIKPVLDYIEAAGVALRKITGDPDSIKDAAKLPAPSPSEGLEDNG